MATDRIGASRELLDKADREFKTGTFAPRMGDCGMRPISLPPRSLEGVDWIRVIYD